MNLIDALILERLYARPSWAKSLRHVRARVVVLVTAGLAERVAPPNAGANARNMIRITDAGINVIEAHWKKK
jgi:hypothetical protein